MFWNKATMLFMLALALGLAVEVADADFTFGIPTNLGPVVNSSAVEAEPSISADGLTLFFNGDRSGGSGGWDIWVTTRETTEDEWTPPINLGPTINSSSNDFVPSMTADGLTLFFCSSRSGGYGRSDIYVTTRETTEAPWRIPTNLGPTLNTSSPDFARVSPDGLALYIDSERSGGFGGRDIWVSTRETTNDPWLEPMHLGPPVNSTYGEEYPAISSDGLAMFLGSAAFSSPRPGGYGLSDIWVTTRKTKDSDWPEPVNLGPIVNSSNNDRAPSISADGSTLYFASRYRPGGYGDMDLWQVSIEPIVDLNGDGIVDSADMCIIVDYWGTDNSLCDVGPMPWGDGIVDVQDLIVLAEHLFEEENPPAQ
jgi:Tol biopolymer transport system component